MVKTKDLLPVNVQDDKNLKALCEAADKVFLLEKELNKLLVYLIDKVDASALPYLAWQFRAEGYELAQTDQEKRNLIKNAIELHRYKGTKWAVERVLSLLNLDGEIKEWFEYGGNPYRFKIELGISNREITPELKDKLIQLISEYKNERSWLDEILLAYFAQTQIGFALGQAAETEFSSECQTDLAWNAFGQIAFALSPFAETEAFAVMEVM